MLARFSDSGFFSLLLCVGLLFLSPLAKAEVDFFVFPELRVDHTESANFSEKNLTPTIDFFVAGEMGEILLLAEAFVGEEAQHFERLQLGLALGGSSKAWLGRYHNPYGYWHTQYHHGTYLQTSISRPAVVALGGGGGVLPSHYSGFLVEGRWERGESGWEYSLAAGLTSQLNGSGGHAHGSSDIGGASLEDLDLFDASATDNEMGYTFRLAYFPDALGENQFGLSVMYGTLTTDLELEPAEDEHPQEEESGPHDEEGDHDGAQPNFDKDITQQVVGLFGNYYLGDIRLLAEAYHIHNEVPLEHGKVSDSFRAAYLQVEYAATATLTPYGRLENSWSTRDDAYLDLLTGFAGEVQMLGLRWDVSKNQALKIEYSNRNFDGDKRGRWLLNWSAVWP